MTRIMQGNAHVRPQVARGEADDLRVEDGDQRPPPAKARQRDVLPPAARAKLIAIQGAAEDAHFAASNAARRMGELRAGLTYSEAPLEKAATINLELVRLDKVRSVQDKRHRELAALSTALTDWVGGLRNAVLEPARLPPLKPGTNLPDAIKRLRDEIADAYTALLQAQHAPPPKEELKRSAHEYVTALAQRGRPRILADGQGMQVRFNDTASYGASDTGALPFLAWLHEADFSAALEREIDGLRADPNALTAEQKAQRLAEIHAQLETLERREEALITQAQEQGVDVLRRPDASPLAVLSVRFSERQTK